MLLQGGVATKSDSQQQQHMSSISRISKTSFLGQDYLCKHLVGLMHILQLLHLTFLTT